MKRLLILILLLFELSNLIFAQQYKIAVDITGWSLENGCVVNDNPGWEHAEIRIYDIDNGYVDVTKVMKDGTQAELWVSSNMHFEDGSESFPQKYSITFTGNKQPKYIQIIGKWAWRNAPTGPDCNSYYENGCGGTCCPGSNGPCSGGAYDATDTTYIDIPDYCINTTFDNNARTIARSGGGYRPWVSGLDYNPPINDHRIVPHYNSIVSIKFDPLISPLTATNTTVYDTENLTTQITSGHPDNLYKWYYAVNNGAFSPIPNVSGPGLNLPLSSLVANTESLINQKLYIKAKVCDSEINFSYTVKLTPPSVTGTEGIAPKCSGGTGQLGLTLNRSLKNNEYLSFRYTKIGSNNPDLENKIYPPSRDISGIPYAYHQNTDLSVLMNGFETGTYTYTITDVYDGGDQSKTSEGTFDIPGTPPVTTITTPPTAYSGNHDLLLQVSGGTGPYNYRFEYTDANNNTNTTSGEIPVDGKITNLLPGHYQLSVTDSNGCSAIFTGANSATTSGFDVIYPLAATISPTVIACSGGNGQLVANASGGFGTYNYSWKKNDAGLGDETNMLTDLDPGIYEVTVTDGNGITATASYELTEPLPVNLSSSTVTPIACYGGLSGAINTTPAGGTGSYNYQWTGPNGFVSSSQNIQALPPGTYSLNLSDSNGCVAAENPYTFSITQPVAPLALTSTYTISTDGPGLAGGEIGLTVTGGTPNPSAGYSVSWEPAISTPQINTTWSNDQLIQTVSNLAAGLYTVTVTDKNLCALTQTFTVADPPPLSASVTQSNITCNGYSNGSVQVSVSGGKPKAGNTYKITWYKNGTMMREDNFLSSVSQISNLTPDSYSAEIEDSKGVKITKGPWNITEPDVLSVGLSAGDVKCFGASTGNIALSISGGTIPYLIKWRTGQTSTSLATANISALPEGTYTVTVTDVNGCATGSTATITQPASPIALSVAEVEHPLQIGATGTISEITISGGVPDYSYVWTRLPGTDVLTGSGNTSSLTSVTAGSYRITATDSNGCTISATYTLKDPLPLVIGLTETQVISCNGSNDGKLHAKATGGVLTLANRYMYEWYRLNAPNDSTLLLKSNTDSIKTQVSPGKYFVWIEDKGGTRKRSDDLQVTEPEVLSSSATTSDVFCYGGNDGSISFQVNGGTAPYQIGRELDGNTQTQTQALSGNGQIVNLRSGNYSVTITDSHGCTVSFDKPIGQPLEKLSVSTTKTRGPTGIGLSTGLIKGQITGGTPDYSSQLKNSQGAIVSTFIGNEIDISGLPQGTYTLTVQDNHFGLATNKTGCQTEVAYTLKDPEPMTATLTQTQQIWCYGETTGALKVMVSGGIELDEGGYLYDWYKIENGVQIPVGTTNTSTTLGNLAAGIYSVKATDQFNNTITSNRFTISQPALLVTSASAQPVSCYQGANGKLTVSVSGGTSPYTGVIQSAAASQSFSVNTPGTKDFQGLTAGVYTITVTDNNHCMNSFPVEVLQPALPVSVTLKGTQPSGARLTNGYISASISGGTPPYSYTWNDSDGQVILTGTGSQTQISNLGKGLYSITIADANHVGHETDNGCKISSLYQLNEPQPLVASLVQTASVLCKGNAEGAFKVLATGGVPATGYQYKWYRKISAADSLLLNNHTDVEKGFNTGTYFVWVVDVNNNKARTSNITVSEPEELTANHTFSDVSCFGGANGFVSVTAAGGVAPYTYSWSNGSNSPDNQQLPAGTYTVTITDANGCKRIVSQTVGSPSSPVNLSGTVTSPTAYMANDGKISVSVNGGVPPYQYTWTKTDGNPVASDANGSAINLSDGFYNLVVSDSHFNTNLNTGDAQGCLQEYNFHVVQPLPLKVKIEELGPVVCHGESNGSLQATASGGISFPGGTYQYKWFKTDGQSVQALSVTGNQLDRLSGGNYGVLVTDANGITQTTTFELTDPATMNISFVKTTTPSNSIEAIVSGGKPPYSYVWNTGDTTSKLTGLADGQYNVWVTDALGCSLVQGTTIGNTIYDPALPTINLSVTQPICATGCTGEASAVVSGGKAPYRFDWGNGGIADNSVKNLCSGTHFLTVTDANQKTATRAFIIKNPDSLTIPVETSVTMCKGEIYKADATVSSPGATYQWFSAGDFISSQPKIDITTAGVYTIAVTSAKGCTTTATINVEERSDPGIDLDYAVTTQAALGRKIVLVNTSLNSDGSEYTGTINWILPPQAVVSSKTNESAEITISNTGNYEVGIETRIFGCKLQKIKNLTITPYNGENEETVGAFQNITVYPNPNTGNFSVKVEMDQPHLVKLFLLNSTNYGIIWSKILSGSASYETNVNISRPVAGVYFILAVSDTGESTIRKIIIQ